MLRVAALVAFFVAGCSGPGANGGDSRANDVACPRLSGVAEQVVVHVIAEDTEAARAHNVARQIAENGTLKVRNMDTYEAWTTVALDHDGCGAYALSAPARYAVAASTLEEPNDGETCGWLGNHHFDYENGLVRVTITLHPRPCYHTDPGPP